MATKYFNFNNEANITELDVNETGKVTFMGEEFESVQEFAEFYAEARDVRHDNLKNWVLVEDNDRFSFVLRAATAGNLTGEQLANLISAGVSYDDIATMVNVLSSTGNSQPNEDVETGDPSTINEQVHQLVSDHEYTELVEYGLQRLYEVETLDDVASAIETHIDENIDELREEYENSEFDEYDEYDAYDDYLSDQEIISLYLNDCVDSATDEAQKAYKHLPLDVIVDIRNNDLDEYRNESEVSRRFKVANLAGRDKLEVLTVTNDFEEPISVSMKSENEIRFNEQYLINGKIFIVEA